MKFFESNVCLDRKHCRTCRHMEGGRGWRQMIGRVYQVDTVDFVCPVGLKWITENTSARDLKAFDRLKPTTQEEQAQREKDQIARAEQKKAGVYDKGVGLRVLELEQEVRAILSSTSPVVAALDTIVKSDAQGGCTSCRRKKLVRAVGVAVRQCTPAESRVVLSLLDGNVPVL